MDFLVGMSMFLIIVIFVLSFVPGMIEPFNDSVQEDTVAVDRVATQLSKNMLGSTGEPYLLDGQCTGAFFGGTDPGNCNFEPADSVYDRVGINETFQKLNITIERDTDGDGDREILRLDSNGEIVPTGGTLLREGSVPPTSSGSVVVARRVVYLDGQDVSLIVRMW
ncbi:MULTISPECIES: hypothetical protein [unclassified Haladaptatus]|uniref:DUF7287 family protein n=1 Tax=unclassified Haladaptatus TaxID=2622732 RepID=UPI0023E7FBD7|nr:MULTISPECIES: hypothetical protein [unclassified Haladaptatus]